MSEFSTVARLPLPAPATREYTVVTDATPRGLRAVHRRRLQPQRQHALGGRLPGRPLFPAAPCTRSRTSWCSSPTATRTRSSRGRHLRPGESERGAERVREQGPARGRRDSSADENPAKDRAVPNANGIKAQGSHILSVAVGEGLDSPSSLSRIIDVSGPDVFTGRRDVRHRDRRRLPGRGLLRSGGRDARGGVPALLALDHRAQARRQRRIRVTTTRPRRGLGPDHDRRPGPRRLGPAATGAGVRRRCPPMPTGSPTSNGRPRRPPIPGRDHRDAPAGLRPRSRLRPRAPTARRTSRPTRRCR